MTAIGSAALEDVTRSSTSTAFEHKVHQGNFALRSLAKDSTDVECSEDSPAAEAASNSSTSSMLHLTMVGPGTPAVKALATPFHGVFSPPARPPSWQARLLSCFGSSGGLPAGDSSEAVSSSHRQPVSVHELGIRPSFYWLNDAQVQAEDRLQAEANARWLKSDCQDEAAVIDNFNGVARQMFVGESPLGVRRGGADVFVIFKGYACVCARTWRLGMVCFCLRCCGSGHLRTVQLPLRPLPHPYPPPPPHSNLPSSGVFDGHGPNGRLAAKYASTHIPRLLASKASAGSRSARKRLSAMQQACVEVDAAMQLGAETGFNAELSGTTACFALIHERQVLLANAGDSRCVVARHLPDGTLTAIPLTTDAKPSLPEEMKRIQVGLGWGGCG
jgi:hypothetical protein